MTFVLCCLYESLLSIMSALASFMQTDRTVLHYAAELGFHDAAKLLLQKQADANAVDKVINSKSSFLQGYLEFIFWIQIWNQACLLGSKTT